jgi:hypothetical protein
MSGKIALWVLISLGSIGVGFGIYYIVISFMLKGLHFV